MTSTNALYSSAATTHRPTPDTSLRIRLSCVLFVWTYHLASRIVARSCMLCSASCSAMSQVSTLTRQAIHLNLRHKLDAVHHTTHGQHVSNSLKRRICTLTFLLRHVLGRRGQYLDRSRSPNQVSGLTSSHYEIVAVAHLILVARTSYDGLVGLLGVVDRFLSVFQVDLLSL